MDGALDEVRLTDALLGEALALSEQAGWNQVAEDWSLMIRDGWAIGLRPAGDPPGALIATALTLPIAPGVAWISMVLVDGAWRRRGIGTRMLRRCIAQLQADGIVPGLDATEAGRLVYRPLGFVETFAIDRLRVPAIDDASPPPAGVGLRPVEAADIDALAAWDAPRSGFRRLPVLAALQRRLPPAAWLAERDGAPCGFVLGRDGRMTSQIGPLVADDPAVARALLGRALAATGAPAILDMPEAHDDLQAWLRDRGAVRQRGYLRMVLGPTASVRPPDRIYALGGPELG